jgi:hypothetical protein
MRLLKTIGMVLLAIFGVYLVGRAAAEPFLINYHNAASYKHDWGGPTLVGVMAVHMLPGVVSLAVIAYGMARMIRSRNRR